jgi:hypothetical protein
MTTVLGSTTMMMTVRRSLLSHKIGGENQATIVTVVVVRVTRAQFLLMVSR